MRLWIKIEPKMAFGSGHHETTRLAASLLSRTFQKHSGESRVLDIGTGSGILCFIASAFGASSIGVEIDSECHNNIAENRDANGDLRPPLFVIGGCNSLKASVRFDIIVMNMLLLEAAPLIEDIDRMCKPYGSFIWSGLLGAEKDAARDQALAWNFHLADDLAESEWWAGLFRHSAALYHAYQSASPTPRIQ